MVDRELAHQLKNILTTISLITQSLEFDSNGINRNSQKKLSKMKEMVKKMTVLIDSHTE